MVFRATQERVSLSKVSNRGLQAPGDGLCSDGN